jgi:hypothetical protein
MIAAMRSLNSSTVSTRCSCFICSMTVAATTILHYAAGVGLHPSEGILTHYREGFYHSRYVPFLRPQISGFGSFAETKGPTREGSILMPE